MNTLVINIINVFGLNVFSDTLDKISLESKTAQTLNTISPNSYGISTKDPEFKNVLKNSDYLVLDGVYFALASIFLNAKNIKKNQGPDVFYYFMNKVNYQKGRVFFLGSSDYILNKIKERASVEYPNLSIESYSPPFKKEFSEEDNSIIRERVNNFSPNVVFVGMTCPKQEKWSFSNKDFLNTNLICCVGAVFDWYAGVQKEIRPIWWKLRLAWLIRTINRPEILKRYPSIGIFFWHLILAILRIIKY